MLKNLSSIILFLVLMILSYDFFMLNRLTANSRTSEVNPVFDEKGIAMVYVPSGEYSMGTELERAIELCELLIPEQFVTIGCNLETYIDTRVVINQIDISVEAFYIDQYEVSLRTYLNCIAADVCREESLGLQLVDRIHSGDEILLDYPVERVDYFSAAIYCAWRGARLPSEAEWEYAARGEQASIFPWGNEFDVTRLNFRDDVFQNSSELLWDDGFERLAPINAFENGQSWVGAYNLAGNVAEWTSTQLINDGGFFENNIRVVKGGSYISYPHETAGWASMPLGQIGIPEGIGFRCVRKML